MAEDKVGILYKALSADENYASSVGDENTFREKMKNPDKAKILYGALAKDERYAESIGDEATFLSKVSSPKPTAPSTQGGESGALKPTVPTPSKESTSLLEDIESESWKKTISPKPAVDAKQSLSLTQQQQSKKYEPSNFGEILEKAKIGVINPDLETKYPPMNVGGIEVSVKQGEAPPMALYKPKKEVDTDIDLLTKRTNVVRKLRDAEIDRAKQLKLGIEQIRQRGSELNEQYKSNPTPELERKLMQTVKDLQETERAYNRAAFAQDIYEKRILQTSDSIKKLANDKVPTNIWEGLYRGIKENVDSWGESYELAKMSKDEQIQYAKDMALQAPTIETSGGGGVAQMVGGVIPDIGVTIGFSLAGLPSLGVTTVAVRQGAQQASDDFVRVFNEVKSTGLPSGKKDANGKDIMREASDDEAYDLAVRAAGVGGATGFIEGVVGTMGGGKIVKATAEKIATAGGKVAAKAATKATGKKIAVGKAKIEGGKIVAEKALDTASDAAIAGGMQVTRNVFDQYQGLDTKITEGVAENMAGEVLLSAPINTIGGAIEYSKEKKEKAVREIFKSINESKSNPYELQKLQSNLDILKNQGLISDVDYNELNKKAEDYIRVVETIPTEVSNKQKAADLIIERDELEAKKESVDKAFQKPIDEKINAINDELVVMATPVELKKNTSPTNEKYGTINRNDGKGVVDLTKEEYLREEGKLAGVEEQLNEQEDVDIQQQVDEEKADDRAVGDIAKEDNAYQESRQITENVSRENPDASILITPKGNDLNLTALYVGKENRGKGIGSKVLESVKKQADKVGKKVVLDATNELDEETDLERLGKFYEANGFTKVGDNKFEYNPNKGDIAKKGEAVSKEETPALSDVESVAKQKELENNIQEIKNKRNALRGEDGVVPNDKISEFNQLGKDLKTAQDKAKRGNSKSSVALKKVDENSPNPVFLTKEERTEAADLIEQAILGSNTPQEVIDKVRKLGYVFNFADANLFAIYLNDRFSDAPQVGNNKSSFQDWVSGVQPKSESLLSKEQAPKQKEDEQEKPTKEDGKPLPKGVQGLRIEGERGEESPELRPEEKGKPIKEKAAKGFISVALNKLTKSLKDFQGRGKDYSQQTYDRIVNEAKEGTLNISSIPPIQIWKDKNGNWVILGGHSRTKAFEDLAAGKHELNSKYSKSDFSSISAQVVEASTLEEAQKIAQESNQGAVQTVVDNAKYVREKLLPKFKSFNEAKIKLRDLYGSSWTRIYAYAHLNPNGKAMSFLKAFSENLESESTDISRKMAEWTGKAMSDFDGLTSQHENEIFDYLLENNKIKTYNEFYDILNRRINGIDGFNPSEPLNFGSKVGRGSNESAVIKEIQEAKAEKKRIEDEIKKVQKTETDKNKRDKTISELTKEAIRLNTLIGDLEKKQAQAREGDALQFNLFNDLNEQIENGNISAEQAEQFLDGENEVEPIIADIERKAEGANEAELNEAIQEANRIISSTEEKVSGGLTEAEKSNLEAIGKDAGVNFQEVRNVYNKYGEGKPLSEITLEDYQRAEEKRGKGKKATKQSVQEGQIDINGYKFTDTPSLRTGVSVEKIDTPANVIEADVFVSDKKNVLQQGATRLENGWIKFMQTTDGNTYLYNENSGETVLLKSEKGGIMGIVENDFVKNNPREKQSAQEEIDNLFNVYESIEDSKGMEKREAAEEFRNMQESIKSPTLKRIFDNIKDIHSQLEKQGLITKTKGCP
jgi:GNAT superfamily N-acetyltransferase